MKLTRRDMLVGSGAFLGAATFGAPNVAAPKNAPDPTSMSRRVSFMFRPPCLPCH